MSRSSKKGPYIDVKLQDKIESLGITVQADPAVVTVYLGEDVESRA